MLAWTSRFVAYALVIVSLGPAPAQAETAPRTIVVPRIDAPRSRAESGAPWSPEEAASPDAASSSNHASSPNDASGERDTPSALGSVSGFLQFEPGDGVPVSHRTEAYLSYDSRNLYIVFVCRDDPTKVRANIARREDIGEDDQVLVYLDTFDDRSRAYLFAANPLGVQLDGVTTEGQGEDWSFDAQWTSEGRMTDDGYVVRMAIPFRSLRFRRTERQTWGVALARVIRRNNERAYWPHITRRVKGFVPQFATLEGLSGISPGRNLQINPHLVFARARVLDREVPARVSQGDESVGLDAKLVLRDAFALDGTIQPDFSQVETDDPQVTVNERFEVFFPEKRPFFLENADYFQTPEILFFSRRIVDPGAGLRLTGRTGRWAVGSLAMNDHAPGRLSSDDDLAGRDAWIGAVRLQRDLGRESSAGVLVTAREFEGSPRFDRMLSGDARFRLGDNWELLGQVMRSEVRDAEAARSSGWGGLGQVSYVGRSLEYVGRYRELTPDFEAPLGFIPRSGFRDTKHEVEYAFRRDGVVTRYGPAASLELNWEHATRRLQDRALGGELAVELKGATELRVGRSELLERFEGQLFRRHVNEAELQTEWLKWLNVNARYTWGTDVNHDPPEGVAPSLGDARELGLSVTLRPTPRLRLEPTYVQSALRTRRGSRRVFTEHRLRGKLHYQFTRALSVRLIVDYEALDADPTLVDEERERSWGADVLLTYLPYPGTAVYLGYTDQYANLAVLQDPEPRLARSRDPDLSVARQLFVKVSYLWRY
jgi:hypothetical protein